MRTLVIDTATAACSVALIEDGRVVARDHAVVGRGHAERLVPMIAGLPDGGRAPRILVDCGPGSFTGVRVGIAAARGLALGWGAEAAGFSSLALIAAAAFAHRDIPALAVVLEGGHGEVFMQVFGSPVREAMTARTPLASLKPEAAIMALGSLPVFGNAGHWLTPFAPDIDMTAALPDAADAPLLPTPFDALPPNPIYGRPPDAKPATRPA